jgi:hypothetical protein
MDIAEDIMAHVEVCLVTGTIYHHSLLLLGEPLVLNLAMLPFISLSYIVLHHNFHFFCLIASSGFKPSW